MTETLIGQRFSAITPEPMERLLEEAQHMPGYSVIAHAVAGSEFRDSHEHSRINIVWRYCRDGMPPWLAVLGIMNGYSSPSQWRHAHRLHKRLGIHRTHFAPVKH